MVQMIMEARQASERAEIVASEKLCTQFIEALLAKSCRLPKEESGLLANLASLRARQKGNEDAERRLKPLVDSDARIPSEGEEGDAEKAVVDKVEQNFERDADVVKEEIS